MPLQRGGTDSSFEVSVFFVCITVFVWWRGLSVCCACLPLGVQSCQAKQSSWLYKGLAVSRSIGVAVMCQIKTRLHVYAVVLCVCVCETFLPWATLAVWGLDTACGCQLLFFPLYLNFSSSDTHFDSLPFRLKFLWLESTILATANYASARLNCDREKEA